MSVIQVHELTKRFGPVLAVDRLSFEVDRGTVVGFLGPNGAGKTTTLRTLVGLVKPTGGSATVNGKAYVELSDPLRHVGAVLEASSFYPSRSARNHLRVQALAGGIDPGRVEDVLELVGLGGAAERKVGGFSLGMRQRLGIATAMLGDPEVLILDEPANGLDPEGVRWLRELVRALAEDGRTVLVSSHILAEVAQTVDSVVIIDRGRLVAQSSLDELTSGRRRVIRVRTPGARELAAAVGRDGVRVEHVASDRLEITGTTPEAVGMLAAELRIPILESTSEAADLEDVFFQLTATGAGHGHPRVAGPMQDSMQDSEQEVSR
jgi:ABC-2 type transport system ATP-binding protein